MAYMSGDADGELSGGDQYAHGERPGMAIFERR